MSINRTIVSVFVFALCAGCSSSESDPVVDQTNSALTYYDDIAPILQDHCLQCHQEGGIAAEHPLGEYATAKSNAAAMAADTAARKMPPWSATSDGSCGEFSGSLALSDKQIDTISKWAQSGAKEGKPHALKVSIAAVDRRCGAVPVATIHAHHPRRPADGVG